MSKPPESQPSAFEQFVQKIAAVPKGAVEEMDAVRPRTIKVKRRRTEVPKGVPVDKPGD